MWRKLSEAFLSKCVVLHASFKIRSRTCVEMLAGTSFTGILSAGQGDEVTAMEVLPPGLCSHEWASPLPLSCGNRSSESLKEPTDCLTHSCRSDEFDQLARVVLRVPPAEGSSSVCRAPLGRGPRAPAVGAGPVCAFTVEEPHRHALGWWSGPSQWQPFTSWFSSRNW